MDPEALSEESFCYVTTTGRRTGRPHTIEIWFAAEGGTIYMLSGEGADWVQNILAEPRVTVRIDGQAGAGQGRAITDPEEEALARRLLPAKYEASYGKSLTSWGRTAFPVAIDLE